MRLSREVACIRPCPGRAYAKCAGVAGVGGRPLPLCRSDGQSGYDES
jgi:hypothetical protein